MTPVRIVPSGDAALVVEWSHSLRPDSTAVLAEAEDNTRAIALAAAFENARIDGVLDIVPTVYAVAVYFDPQTTTAGELASRLEHQAASSWDQPQIGGRLHRIPVCYGGSFGPDLADVAETMGLTEDAVSARHAAPVYRVSMIGFMPGFAYMGPLDPAIALSRRPIPRTRVAVGSVAIAGTQTGIYPVESPGGWHVIGRTPVRPFDLQRAEPFLFKAGDAVQFYPIDTGQYTGGSECLPSA